VLHRTALRQAQLRNEGNLIFSSKKQLGEAKNASIEPSRRWMVTFPISMEPNAPSIPGKKIAEKWKGCLLLLDSNMARRSSVESVAQSDPIVCSVVDWIHADIPEIHQIANAAGISLGNRDALETQLKEECEQASRFNGYKNWLANTLTLNHCE
jgi:hypothetical protein